MRGGWSARISEWWVVVQLAFEDWDEILCFFNIISSKNVNNFHPEISKPSACELLL